MKKSNGFIIYLNDSTTKVVEYDFNLAQLDYITMKYSFNEIKRILSKESQVDLRDFNKINIISDGIIYNFQNKNEFLKDCLKVNENNKFSNIIFNTKLPGKNNGRFLGCKVNSNCDSFIQFSNFISKLIYYKKDEDIRFFDCMYQDCKDNMEYNRNITLEKDKKKVNSFYLKVLSNMKLGQTPEGMEDINNHLSNYVVFRSFAVRYKDALSKFNRYKIDNNIDNSYVEIKKEEEKNNREYVDINEYDELKEYDSYLTLDEVEKMYGRK